jgi:Mrp family chromosome partitioning ATPase
LSELVDGFLMVVRAEHTPKRLIASGIKSLPRDKIIGFVLNQSTAFGRTAYGYHYYKPYPY